MTTPEDISPPRIDLGRIAFESYRASCAGLTYDGKPIPEWDNLDGDREATQQAWQAAGSAVAQTIAHEFVAQVRVMRQAAEFYIRTQLSRRAASDPADPDAP